MPNTLGLDDVLEIGHVHAIACGLLAIEFDLHLRDRGFLEQRCAGRTRNRVEHIDDLVPIVTAYQIEWNKMHERLRGIAVDLGAPRPSFEKISIASGAPIKDSGTSDAEISTR